MIETGIVVLHEDLARVVAESDIYVACSSATLRIAEALGVHAIDYDIYALGYQDFEAARVVRTANDVGKFRNVVLDVIANPVAYEMDHNIASNPVQAIIQMALAKQGLQIPKANRVI